MLEILSLFTVFSPHLSTTRVCKVFGSVFMLRSVRLVCPNKSPKRHSLANIAKRVSH